MQKYTKYLKVGMKFNRLTVIDVDETSKTNKNGNAIIPSEWKYKCRCTCGNITSVKRSQLINERTKSCGCLQKEKARQFCNNFSKTNPIEDCGDYIKIFFFNKEHGFTIIDKEDYGKVKDFCWHQDTADSMRYARTRIKATDIQLRMHQLIFLTEIGFIPEHRDGDGLNNRKSNLRIGTKSQNEMNKGLRKHNTSGCTGISWCTKSNKWRARLTINKKVKYLGSF